MEGKEENLRRELTKKSENDKVQQQLQTVLVELFFFELHFPSFQNNQKSRNSEYVPIFD